MCSRAYLASLPLGEASVMREERSSRPGRTLRGVRRRASGAWRRSCPRLWLPTLPPVLRRTRERRACPMLAAPSRFPWGRSRTSRRLPLSSRRTRWTTMPKSCKSCRSRRMLRSRWRMRPVSVGGWRTAGVFPTAWRSVPPRLPVFRAAATRTTQARRDGGSAFPSCGRAPITRLARRRRCRSTQR